MGIKKKINISENNWIKIIKKLNISLVEWTLIKDFKKDNEKY